ncbi:DUF92 domain-containing protein [Danxiaibacter flavus]|uniref:DUF92 domain-containing protein n=1 Tax=Danxiaibacter flavus TaxID=3049108 RepID=A0ABV3ZGT1_9BACT|nr:DUF92 domain-containing protein [Chitinophagaceae bacterium DXS]
MSTVNFQLLLLLAVGAIAAVLLRKLTPLAGIAGACVGWLVYLGAGYAGIAVMASFFILGTAASSWQYNKKARLLIAEQNKGRRTTGQVLANAGIAGLMGLLTVFLPQYTTLSGLMMAASFSSATADTLSSELGNVYGKRFYNILTLKKDTRGLNGVISLEGTLAGFAGSALIAVVYVLFTKQVSHFWIIVIAGTIGNLTDSLLGASWERRHLLNNNAVNFLNTLVAALFCLLISFL